jgi:predicted TPR repeat methyltransferase
MLEKAAARGGYDELVAAELTAFTDGRADVYDVIACADTLCYFGRLEAVMAAAAKALRPGGYFIFTLEKTPPTKNAVNFTLEHSGRYTHTEPYARSVIAGAGMEVTKLTCKALRKELFVPVEGMVVVARKPAA